MRPINSTVHDELRLIRKDVNYKALWLKYVAIVGFCGFMLKGVSLIKKDFWYDTRNKFSGSSITFTPNNDYSELFNKSTLDNIIMVEVDSVNFYQNNGFHTRFNYNGTIPYGVYVVAKYGSDHIVLDSLTGGPTLVQDEKAFPRIFFEYVKGNTLVANIGSNSLEEWFKKYKK